MNDVKNYLINKFSKETVNNLKTYASIVLLCVSMVLLLFVHRNITEPPPPGSGVRSELRRQGYCTENIDFEFVKRGQNIGQRIYQSSEPIFFQGEYVTYWLLTIITISHTSRKHLNVRPYISTDH